jgi:hypothetical protein
MSLPLMVLRVDQSDQPRWPFDRSRYLVLCEIAGVELITFSTNSARALRRSLALRNMGEHRAMHASLLETAPYLAAK